MADYPLVTIVLVTYDRPNELRTTVASLMEHIVYPPERLRWHLADDGSPDPLYCESVIHESTLHGDVEMRWSATQTTRKGWGANVNKALLHAMGDTEYVYLNEDDYVAQKTLRLDLGVQLMETVSEIGLVRYDGLSAHIGMILRLKEAKSADVRLDYLELDRASPLLNVYSHRPHLRHRRFTACVGMYPEGLSLGATEEAYAHRVRDMQQCPQVAVLDDGIVRAFDHIGRSRQGSDEDVGR